MMATFSNVGPDALSRTDRLSNGLSSMIRDPVAFTPSRVDMLLGISSQPVASPSYDANELNEEDVWGSGSDARALPEESSGFGSDVGKHDGGSTLGGMNVTKDMVDADPFRFVTNSSRRWLGREKESGLSVAYTDAGRSRGFPGAFNLATVAANAALANAALANGNGSSSRTHSRLIPGRDFPSPRSGVASSSVGVSKVLHQSAPVNVPDWSKILGSERKPVKVLAEDDLHSENDEDEERLPPHELIAREYAKSQVATFSMCEGAGRTLKGRDLSRVRTAVLRQTGFLKDQ